MSCGGRGRSMGGHSGGPCSPGPLPCSCQNVHRPPSQLRAPHRQRLYPRKAGKPRLGRKRKGIGPLGPMGSGYLTTVGGRDTC